MSSRIPPLLEPALSVAAHPSSSLSLVTSVLGASANWLLLRYLYDVLVRRSALTGGVVFVSFLRDRLFWRDGAARLGLDLDAPSRAGRFVFVDGISALSLGSPPVQGPQAPRAVGVRVLTSVALDHVRAEIDAALETLATTTSSPPLLLVDQMDALLAIGGSSEDEDGLTTATPSLSLQNILLSLRQRARATILALSADTPLLLGQTTTLEREHAALVLSQAHVADAVISLRPLDTGSARDVSGVVRITPGGGAADAAHQGGKQPEEEHRVVEEREFLYHVGGDGAVAVFERGA